MVAATRMTEALIPPDVLKLMAPQSCTPVVLFQVSEKFITKAARHLGLTLG